MKKLVTTLLTVAAVALVATASFAASAVRISQVYGGGGGSGTYTNDYVELFNSSAVPVDMSGWALEYGSATGNWGSSSGNYFVLPAGTIIQPCSYLLIQTGSAGTAGEALPVTPDLVTASINAGQTNGKIGLFTALQANVACTSVPAGVTVDKVSYGTANCWEGAAACGALTNTTVAVRANGGLTDTDENGADFAPVAAGPIMHNAASGANAACLATPSMKGTWGALKSIYR
ncbi:MAG: lamin tail domain-containing protein [Candidatus Eisenbacteria bacterium]|nr:lamin tail domain-containing protein [Candidatus Eisenbacteria bacterium]